jgi:hypothetical protein
MFFTVYAAKTSRITPDTHHALSRPCTTRCGRRRQA